MFKMNKIVKNIAFILGVISLAFGFNYALSAWTEPAAVPPSGNVDAPLNTGTAGQTKTGGLILGTNCVAPCTVGLIIDKGNVGIGTSVPSEKLEVIGNVKAVTFLNSSDERLKENISKIENSLDKILKLNGVSFNWKGNGEKGTGLIAQNVESVFPELVKTDINSGMKSVEYGNLVAPLIEAIKEQQKTIESQQRQIDELKALLAK